MESKRSKPCSNYQGWSCQNPRIRWLTVWLVWAIAAVVASPTVAQETVKGVNPMPGFDHSETGFALTGKHATLICESCHVDNKLKGTPRACVACHNGSLAKGKPRNHPPAGTQCTQCHTTRNFRPFAVNHTMIAQPCATCHNGRTAFGKPANHIPANDQCDDCHVTTSKKDVRVDHRDVIGSCVSCHNGKIAMGQPKNHIAAPNECGACHTTFQFKNPIVNHSMLFQPCAACHNRGTVAANSADRTPPDWHRVLGMTDCESCHLPGASWSGAFMDHSRASSDSDCVACHFAFGASGPPNPNVSSRLHTPDESCTTCHALP